MGATADNTTLAVTSGGDTVRDKDRSGVKTQVVGLDLAIGAGTEVLAGTVTSAALTTAAGFGAISLGSFSSSSPAANSSIAANTAGSGIIGIGFSNTNFVGTLAFDATTDGTNWFGISVLPQGQDTQVQTIALTSGTHFQAKTGCAGYQQVRVRCTAFTSGSGTAYLVPTMGTDPTGSSTTGASSIGSVTRMGMGHTGTGSSVTAATSSTTVLAANTARIGATVFNDSTATLYLALFSGASTTSYTAQVGANAYYEVPFGYDGIITGVWSAANGNVRVTEIT